MKIIKILLCMTPFYLISFLVFNIGHKDQQAKSNLNIWPTINAKIIILHLKEQRSLKGGNTILEYICDIKYSIEGNEYIKNNEVFSEYKKKGQFAYNFEINDKIEISYNPNNPKEFLINFEVEEISEKDIKGFKYSGIAGMILSFIGMALLIRNGTRLKSTKSTRYELG